MFALCNAVNANFVTVVPRVINIRAKVTFSTCYFRKKKRLLVSHKLDI